MADFHGHGYRLLHEFYGFSREGFPAVTTRVSLLKPELEPLRRASLRDRVHGPYLERPTYSGGAKGAGSAVSAVAQQAADLVGSEKLKSG